MKDLLILAVHRLATIAKLVRPGGVRGIPHLQIEEIYSNASGTVQYIVMHEWSQNT
jgi:hypothetical protein